jgi:hypothetical protein
MKICHVLQVHVDRTVSAVFKVIVQSVLVVLDTEDLLLVVDPNV